MNLECGGEEAGCCRSSGEHSECINKTILRFRCWSNFCYEAAEMSLRWWRCQDFPDEIGNTEQTNSSVLKSCFLPINCQDWYIFLLLFFSFSFFFHLHILCKSGRTPSHRGSVCASGLRIVLPREFSRRSRVQKEKKVVAEQHFYLRSDGFLVVTLLCAFLTFIFFADSSFCSLLLREQQLFRIDKLSRCHLNLCERQM